MGNYSIVSNRLILDTNISNSAKVLYITLNSLAEDLNHIQISEKELAKIQDITDRTVRNGLAELEAYGLISKYRKNLKEVQTYIIIPYEIRRVVAVETEEEFNSLLQEIYTYIDTEVKHEKPKTATAKEDKEYTARDYCKYFSDVALEKKGVIVNYGNAKAISIMKRVTKGRTFEENKLLIDTFISIYDSKFKKVGYEYPTIESFGTSWIFNKVLEISKHIKTDTAKEKILDIVF